MKLTMTKVINLHGGLSSLDAYEKVVGDKVVKELYQLGGPLRLNIARNLNRIESEVAAFQKTRNALVVEHSNGSGTVDMPAFVMAERALLDSETEIDLILLKEADLSLNINPIPGTVLAAIMPILE